MDFDFRWWRIPDGLNGCYFLVFGLLMFCCSAFAGIRDLRYSFSAKPATAQVTECWMSRDAEDYGVHSTYAFTVDGKSYKGNDGDHQIGDQIPILYLPADPSENRLPGERTWGIGGAVFLVLGLAGIIFGVSQYRKDTDLLTP